jgi:predicted transcriptional regulator
MTIDPKVAELTAHIVAGYVEKNPVSAASLPDLIVTVGATLAGLGTPAEAAAPELVPPVNPKRSVHADYIISLEDGKKYKSLRRHLGVRGLTPEEYRQKWNLKSDYPMVAPAYAAARSELAKKMGLGRKAKAEPKPRRKARAK